MVIDKQLNKQLLIKGCLLLVKVPQYTHVHDLPAWHSVMWLRTFFIVQQWGRVHIWYFPLNNYSLFWHLSACSNNTSCCWISFRLSESGVSLLGAGGLCEVVDPPRAAGWPITSSSCLGGCVCRGTCTTGWLAAMSLWLCVCLTLVTSCVTH